MPIIFKLDFKNLKKNVLKDISRTVSKVTNMVYQDIIELSPIDTWEYLSNHKNMGIRIEKTRVIWTIENVWEYTERVEKGFRKTPVNWHLLNIWQIYYSRGANVYEKAIAKNKDFFIKSLR
jgi:hypothetical protein